MKKSIYIFLAILVSFSFGFGLNSFISEETKEIKKVTGIGGVFFKCKDPKKLKEWYKKNLGLNTDQYGTNFQWYQGADSTKKGYTQWSPFSEKTTYFGNPEQKFMINYRVADMDYLVKEFKKEGIVMVDSVETVEYGKFLHILDLEGNRVELWEPYDNDYGKITGGLTY
ncbi:MAG: VOC family protein [Bacteroidota bacterium]